jgi:hypothetical protein
MYGARGTMAKTPLAESQPVDRAEGWIALGFVQWSHATFTVGGMGPLARQMILRWRCHDNTVINICGRSIGCASICRDTGHPRIRRDASGWDETTP